MRHNCKKLQELRKSSDIDIYIKGDEDTSPRRLFLLDDKKHIGMGMVISYCPCCGEKLTEQRKGEKMKKTQKELNAITIKLIFGDLDSIVEDINKFIKPRLNELIEQIEKTEKPNVIDKENNGIN